MSFLNISLGLFAQIADSPAISISGLINAVVPIVGLVGGCLILWGAYGAIVRQISAESSRLRGQPLADDPNTVRPPFAHYLALGLEFMIAASAIKTLVTPDLQQVGVLVGMVLSRAVVGLYPRWEKSKWIALADDSSKNQPIVALPDATASAPLSPPHAMATAATAAHAHSS